MWYQQKEAKIEISPSFIKYTQKIDNQQSAISIAEGVQTG